jgi:hypothetical protein
MLPESSESDTRIAHRVPHLLQGLSSERVIGVQKYKDIAGCAAGTGVLLRGPASFAGDHSRVVRRGNLSRLIAAATVGDDYLIGTRTPRAVYGPADYALFIYGGDDYRNSQSHNKESGPKMCEL